MDGQKRQIIRHTASGSPLDTVEKERTVSMIRDMLLAMRKTALRGEPCAYNSKMLEKFFKLINDTRIDRYHSEPVKEVAGYELALIAPIQRGRATIERIKADGETSVDNKPQDAIEAIKANAVSLVEYGAGLNKCGMCLNPEELCDPSKLLENARACEENTEISIDALSASMLPDFTGNSPSRMPQEQICDICDNAAWWMPDTSFPDAIASKWRGICANDTTGAAYEWIVSNLCRAIDMIENGDYADAYHFGIENGSMRGMQGKTYGKHEFAVMFSFLYLDDKAMEADEEADEFLPALMPIAGLLLDYQILPNGMVHVVRCSRRRLQQYLIFLNAVLRKFTEATRDCSVHEKVQGIPRIGSADNERKIWKPKEIMEYIARHNNQFSVAWRDLSDDGVPIVTDMDVEDGVTTAQYMKMFLSNPVFAKDGTKLYPNIFVGNLDGDYSMPVKSLRWVGCKWANPIAVAEAGIAFGFLNGETLEIKMNPLTGKPYCPEDYEKGLLNDDIVKTVWVHYGEYREEKLDEQ